jgi:subtilisin family serine protease
MRSRITTLLLLSLAVSACDTSISPAPDTAPDTQSSARYLVIVDDVPLAASKKPATIISDISSEFGAEPESSFLNSITGFSAILTPQQAARIEADPRILFVEPDRVESLPEFSASEFVDLGGPQEDGEVSASRQVRPWGIRRIGGHTPYTGSSVAWVIDTGIDLDHPDLNVDASRGFNAISSGRDARSLNDRNGHGSHVSGTIAAIANGFGVVGVAAGATVIPVKVLNGNGSGFTSGVIAGVDHVAANGAVGDVANMSLGGSKSRALNMAVKAAGAAGIRFAMAAGNESTHAKKSSPGRANGPNLFTVSSFGKGDIFSTFSNFGNPPIDFAAPGERIASTYKKGRYRRLSGTSMAAPHVAGLLLLGPVGSDGVVSGDRDSTPDVIAHN